MATSSSDFSGEAPVDFHLTSSVEESGSRLSNSSLEKCLLCCNARKTFYCKQCVQNGDFLHSTRYQERFAEKQVQLVHLNNKKRKIQELCEQHLEKHVRASQMRYEIDACKERTRLLQLLVHETKQNIDRGSSTIAVTTTLTPTANNASATILPCDVAAGKAIDLKDSIDTAGFHIEMGTAQFGAWASVSCWVGLSVFAVLKLCRYHQLENMRVSMFLERQRLINGGSGPSPSSTLERTDDECVPNPKAEVTSQPQSI